MSWPNFCFSVLDKWECDAFTIYKTSQKTLQKQIKVLYLRLSLTAFRRLNKRCSTTDNMVWRCKYCSCDSTSFFSLRHTFGCSTTAALLLYYSNEWMSLPRLCVLVRAAVLWLCWTCQFCPLSWVFNAFRAWSDVIVT